MSVAKDCQRYAVRCLQDARTTLDPRLETFLVEMAQAWQRLPPLSWIVATDFAAEKPGRLSSEKGMGYAARDVFVLRSSPSG
jgi:hypothetical protein